MIKTSRIGEASRTTGANRHFGQRLAFRIYKSLFVAASERRARKTITLSPGEISRLHYFQYNSRTTALLKSMSADCGAVTVATTPHAAFARAVISNTQGTGAYQAYLEASWNNPPAGKVNVKVASFKALVETFQRAPTTIPPVLLTQIGCDGPYYVVDGNHRCAVALALGKPVKANVISLETVLKKDLSGRYVARTVPKLQLTDELTLNDSACLPGPYSERNLINALPSSCIQGKHILDIGCGFGARAMLARKMGAKSVVGIDERHGYADIAARTAALTGAWPNVRFFESLPAMQAQEASTRFDTIFLKDTSPAADELLQELSALGGQGWQSLCVIACSDLSPEDFSNTIALNARSLGRIGSQCSPHGLGLWLFEKPPRIRRFECTVSYPTPKTAVPAL